jgi:acyl-coenzyme A synthetase/AMP-(fatty) acid ligase/SAM-dependent methyltransferase/uncharacterized protein YbaR (Trm112 family)
MKYSTLSFCCPECRSKLDYEEMSSPKLDSELGYFVCQSCDNCIPVINGFPMFPESFSDSANYGNEIPTVLDRVKSRDQYREFIYQQSLRPVFDPYAAYYPFNEGLLGFLRLTKQIRTKLKPGSQILDLNCRTGWTGELLASLFPQQHVVSLWEGNQGFLGYSGFNYWLSESCRSENLTIIFNNDKEKIPFPDNTFDFVIGFDFLHHHSDSANLKELLRVATDNSPLVFPHVHTNHSVPEPYFERGGKLISAADWCEIFSALEQNPNRFPCVISELEVYNNASFVLETREKIEHYNCCVMYIPNEWKGCQVDFSGHEDASKDSYLFSNPLVNANLSSGILSIDPECMDHGVRHLLDRHPAIEDDLSTRLDSPLSRFERQIIYWADKGLTCAQTADRLQISLSVLNSSVQKLTARRVLMAFPVSSAMWELQKYARFRHIVRPPTCHVFAQIWTSMTSAYGANPVILNHDGSEFSTEHVSLFVNANRRLFRNKNIGKGDYILICSEVHLEILIVSWAAWLEGIIIVVANPDGSTESIEQLFRDIPISLIFSDRDMGFSESTSCIAFDDTDNSSSPLLSELIEPYFDLYELPVVVSEESDVCLILSTSGSTGKPKRVMLSQGSLFRSGESLYRCMGWRRGERVLSLGPMYTMSGLRNPAVSSLQAGAVIVIPSPEQQKLFSGSLRLIDEFSVNIISAVPAFIENLYNFIEQDRNLSLPDVRLVMSTASKLDVVQKNRVSTHLDLKVVDYYGLTETGGICIAQLPGKEYSGDAVGEPINCIVEIRNENSDCTESGIVGELYIYSDNLMSGYLHNVDVNQPEGHTISGGQRLHKGWLATGDQARILPGGDIELLGRYDGAVKNRQGEFLKVFGLTNQ